MSLLTLKTFLSPEVTSVFKHVSRLRMKSPKGSFARLVRSSRNFDKAIIEGKRMTYRVLPSLLILTIVWEVIHDKLINFTQSQHLRCRLLNSHGNQTDVRVGRLGMSLIPSVKLLGANSLKESIGRVETHG